MKILLLALLAMVSITSLKGQNDTCIAVYKVTGTHIHLTSCDVEIEGGIMSASFKLNSYVKKKEKEGYKLNMLTQPTMIDGVTTYIYHFIRREGKD
jgi:hypothetical protein